MDYDMLLDRFLANVKEHGEKRLFTFVDDKGKEVETYTYTEVENATRTLATALVTKEGCKEGDNVLLVYPPGLDFIIAFLACLRAKLVAVPVYPPHPSRKKDILQFISVQSSCKAKVALTNGEYNYAKKAMALKNVFTNQRSVNKTWPELKWIVTDKLASKSAAASGTAVIDKATDSDLAFLQYTSGSTSAPKGVMLTHNNLSHNLSCIVRSLEASNSTVVVSWLPQYHDMGLIGAYLGVIYCGGSGIYMSPFSFVKNPVLWLQMISQYGATHVQAPNFAYRLVLRKFKDFVSRNDGTDANINLASLKHIFNAAEPIDVSAMKEFEAVFGEYGLQDNVFSPGYGLAENSVYVCDHGKVSVKVDKKILEKDGTVDIVDTDDADKIVSVLQGCGDPNMHPENNIIVRVVDVEGDKNELIKGEGKVGEVWIASPSKAVGYYGLDELTNSHLKAKINIAEGNRADGDDILLGKEWLRTGDLGFFYSSELFICGRIKDLIIIRGRNHYPQDIEFTVENNHYFAKHVRPGCSACFALTKDDDEVLVIVAEVRTSSLGKNGVELKAMADAIRKAVLAEHEISPYSVVLIKQGTINKTTSGKIKRHGVRNDFEDDKLQQVYRLQVDMKQVETEENGIEAADDVEEEDKQKDDVPQSAIDAVVAAGGKSIEQICNEMKDEVARLLLVDIAEVKENVSLKNLGMDSLAVTQFKGVIARDYNVELDEEMLFTENPSLNRLAKIIFSKINGLAVVVKEEVVQTENTNNPNRNSTRRAKKFICC